MSKKTQKILVVALLSVCLLGSTAYAGPIVKFARGLTNIITSPAELIYQPKKLEADNNAMVAWIAGFPKGLFWFPVRMLQGVYSIVTFPLPWPDSYGSWLEPETMIEGMQEGAAAGS